MTLSYIKLLEIMYNCNRIASQSKDKLEFDVICIVLKLPSETFIGIFMY